jgi:hypothetical protein
VTATLPTRRLQMSPELATQPIAPKAGESPILVKGAKLSKDDIAKLEAGYRFVDVPERDTYDYEFQGFWINNTHLKPGKHLLPADWADEAERILRVWDAANRRLLQTKAHNKSIAEASQGQMAVPAGE